MNSIYCPKCDLEIIDIGAKCSNCGHQDKINETVNELFAGEKAELAKQRAFLIRWTLEGKIKGD